MTENGHEHLVTLLPSDPVTAIVRVRLAPWLRSQAFERWLRAIPAVQYAALVTGDVDYEIRLECRDFADLGDLLAFVRGCRAVEVESIALVLHEVEGLGQRRRDMADEVTVPRLRAM